MEPGQIEECNSPQQKHDVGAKTTPVIPLTPKTIHIQGSANDATCSLVCIEDCNTDIAEYYKMQLSPKTSHNQSVGLVSVESQFTVTHQFLLELR